MDTGRQRGKHMKLSLTKFLLDVSTKQEIQLDQGRICGQMQNVSTDKGKSSYYSAMPRARGLKFYYVIADPKVGE